MEKRPNFEQFYIEMVQPHRELHPDYIRLDGSKGPTWEVFGHFYYGGDKWNVHEDTHIDKLKEAYERFKDDPEPFNIVPTEKSICLEVKGNKGPKMLYIYKA